MGDFVTVGVMGGQQIASVGKMIQVQMSYLQFPAAAANAVILLAIVLMIIVGADPRWSTSARSCDAPTRRRPASLLLARGASSPLFVLFLYGPMITIFVLSFQGPQGGLTFPMNGVSPYWFAKLWAGRRRGRHRRGVPALARGSAPW